MGASGKPNAMQLTGEPETLQYAPALNVQLDRMTKTPSGLLYMDREIGTGAGAAKGKRVSVGYVGSLANGKIFDQSGPGDPIQFVLGRGQVISGWDEGIAGMKVGGKRLLVIRPSLAYGNASPGAGIPPNATLVFEVTLDGVQ
jgi:FKBP-type peptidyl-prolyl cis-trans isomerase